MNKNLILVQNGFPGSNTSGTEVDTLDIKNFFKFEKSIVPTTYVKFYKDGYYGMKCLPPFENIKYDTDATENNEEAIIKISSTAQYYDNDTGKIQRNNNFNHYSVSFLLFAVRMKKGFLGTNITITSRLPSDSPLKIRFHNLGYTVDDFKSHLSGEHCLRYDYRFTNYFPHLSLYNSIMIPSLNQYNHCFLAALFSNSVYELESGTILLNNEPLLNISWTETEFTEAQ